MDGVFGWAVRPICEWKKPLTRVNEFWLKLFFGWKCLTEKLGVVDEEGNQRKKKGDKKQEKTKIRKREREMMEMWKQENEKWKDGNEDKNVNS